MRLLKPPFVCDGQHLSEGRADDVFVLHVRRSDEIVLVFDPTSTATSDVIYLPGHSMQSRCLSCVSRHPQSSPGPSQPPTGGPPPRALRILVLRRSIYGLKEPHPVHSGPLATPCRSRLVWTRSLVACRQSRAEAHLVSRLYHDRGRTLPPSMCPVPDRRSRPKVMRLPTDMVTLP